MKLRRPPAFLIGFVGAAAATAFIVEGGAWWVARQFVGPPVERFRSGVFEFQLAPGWQCREEGTEFICEKGKPPYAAIVVLTMKWRGSTDTLAAYRQHLSTPQQRSFGGRTWTSTVVNVESRRIGGREWIVGRHFESELRNFYTDYYAALTSHKAVLVTFSVHQSAVAATRPEFRRMVESLLLFQE